VTQNQFKWLSRQDHQEKGKEREITAIVNPLMEVELNNRYRKTENQ
jgi:hypothetical protein